MTAAPSSLADADVRVLHDGGWIHPGGGARVAVEIAAALDAPVTVGHTECPDWWRDQPVDVEIAFNDELHDGLAARVLDRPALRPAAELRLGQCFRTLDLDEDVIISSGTPAKWWVPKWHQTRVHYCHVPPPRLYGEPDTGLAEWAVKTPVRMLDSHFAGFVDAFIANSEFTQARVQKHYGAEADVINPPVRVDRFGWRPPSEDRYLVHIGRLTPMKRVDMIAEAMDRVDSDVQLVMIGDGPLRGVCERRDNISVYSGLSDWAVEQTVSRCVGGIAFARQEHCGMTPKELQAAGKPVVVPDEPNLCNHVDHGETGVVADISPDAIADAIDALVVRDWDREQIQAAADAWSTDRFHDETRAFVSSTLRDSQPVEQPARQPVPAVLSDGGDR